MPANVPDAAVVVAALHGWDGAAWDQLLSQANNADSVAAVAGGLLGTVGYQYVWDSAGGNWDRLVAIAGGMVVNGPVEDEDAFTFGTTRVFPFGAVADTTPDTLLEDQVGIPRMTLNRILRAVLTDPTSGTDGQAVLAAADDLDETLARYAATLAVGYSFDGTTLRRVLSTDQDTGVGTDHALDIALMVPAAGGGAQLGVIDDVAVAAAIALAPIAAVADPTDGTVDANDTGFVRMTASRTLQVVVSDPTAPATQRQVVSDATGAAAENATQWATVLAALSALDTAAGAGSQQVPLLVESTAAPNLRAGLFEGANQAAVLTGGADALALTTNELVTAALGYVYNSVAGDLDLLRSAESGTDLLAGLLAIGNYLYDGATWDRQIIAGLAGIGAIGGGLAHDAAISTLFPVVTAGRSSTTAPAAVSGDGDVVSAWMMRQGAQVTIGPVPLVYNNLAVAADVDALGGAAPATTGQRIMGFSATETTAAAGASFRLVNGATGAAAGKVYRVNLAPNESRGENFGPNGLPADLGISIDWLSGALEIQVQYLVIT